MDRKDLSDDFRSKREGFGFSRMDLASKSGIPHSWIKNLENGIYINPDKERIEKLNALFESNPEINEDVIVKDVNVAEPPKRPFKETFAKFPGVDRIIKKARTYLIKCNKRYF